MYGKLVLASLVGGVLLPQLGFPLNPWAWYVYLLGLVSDMWTTLKALEMGGVEGNPVVRGVFRLGPWGHPLLSMLVTLFMGGLLQQLPPHGGLPQAALATGTVHLVAAYHNLVILRTLSQQRYPH